MIDHQEFICALKSSWIKRLLHSDAKWTKLIEIIFKIDIRDFWKNGLDFIFNLSLNTTNIFFWKEVLQSWIRVINSTRKEIRYKHTWTNPYVRIDNSSIYLKNYYNAGFTFIIDLFDNNGNFISLEGVKELKVKTNFVEYAGLKNAIFTKLSNKDTRNDYEPSQ